MANFRVFLYYIFSLSRQVFRPTSPLQNRRNFLRILGAQRRKVRKRGERETRVVREGKSAKLRKNIKLVLQVIDR